MTISYTTGDLMGAKEIALAHGCNCQGAMGAGVARLVREWHPEVYVVYKAACDDGSFRVGSALPVWCAPSKAGDRLVYNLGTQRYPGANATPWGVFLSFANMAEDAWVRGIDTISIPRIGAGIGGLNWDNDVLPAIEEALSRSTHPDLHIIIYDLETP